MKNTAIKTPYWICKMALYTIITFMVFSMIVACTATSASNMPAIIPKATAMATVEPTATVTPVEEATPITCVLSPVVVPTLPAEIPEYTMLDQTTGLHMTGTYQMIDIETYRLEITGKVDHPLKLSYDNLRCMPRIEATPLLICYGYFQDEATWAGVPIYYLLGLAGVQADAKNIRLYSADGYSTSIPIDMARAEKNFLAYEWEGQPLPILHGFPVRAVFPGMAGGYWVKWLIKIEII
jgi:DMSO/TMAO reductase YedYZ molybdopterin-dependent catalytic subunit